MGFAAVILAGGASRRMGTDKALLHFRGESFLDRLIRILGGHCAPVVVVLGYHADSILRGATREALFVINPEPERGMLSSLQTGLGLVTGGFLFTPVDAPSIAESTVARLVGAPSEFALAIPRFGGLRGHPVRVGAGLRNEFLALPATGSPKDVILAHESEIHYIDVDDPGILRDVDDPVSYQALNP